jgi:hypothetical protein
MLSPRRRLFQKAPKRKRSMRINVHSDELNARPEIVGDTNNDGTFTGVRFNLGASGSLGKVPGKSAVTLWGKGDGRDLIPLFETAIADLRQRQDATQREPAHA